MIQKWEYLVGTLPPGQGPQQLADSLNTIGEKGWEVIQLLPGGVVAKRPKSAIIRPETVSSVTPR